MTLGIQFSAHCKPVYLDETIVEEVVMKKYQIKFVQCVFRLRARSAATAIPITCGDL